MRGEVGYLVAELLITLKFKGFLQFLYGPQWEDKFMRGGEMLLAQLGASISGYSLLTRFQRSHWDGLFSALTSAEFRSQSVRLDESGGFLDLQ